MSTDEGRKDDQKNLAGRGEFWIGEKVEKGEGIGVQSSYKLLKVSVWIG